MKDNQERLIRYLSDAWSVEDALATSLRSQAKKSSQPEVARMYEEHAMLTESQKARIEERMTALGAKPSSGKGLFTTMMATIADFMHKPADEYDEEAQLLMKSYAIEHLESAMYRSMEVFAEAIGDQTTATLAATIRAEEEATAQRLWPFIGRIAEVPSRV